jgi:hypothetical protein
MHLSLGPGICGIPQLLLCRIGMAEQVICILVSHDG